MGYKRLINKIDELRELVGGWENQQQRSQIELDLALDRVKKIYELLRFPSEDEERVEVAPEPIKMVEPKVEPVVDVTPQADPKFVEPEPQPEMIEEDDEMLLDIDTLKNANSERYNKILSLYCDIESQEPIIPESPNVESAPEPAPAPVVEQIETITTTTTVSSTASSSNRELYKISSQLGINDRFLLANDLFGGDISALSETLATLDELHSLDDVMIHIAENYKWNGDSEGAKLLFTLLQNRFL